MRSTNRAPLDTAAIRLAQAADEPRLGLISDALLLDAVAALREAGQPGLADELWEQVCRPGAPYLGPIVRRVNELRELGVEMEEVA